MLYAYICTYICSYICVYNLCYLIQQTPATHTHWALEMWLVRSEGCYVKYIWGFKDLVRKNEVNYYVNNFYIDYILNDDILDILDEMNWIIKINLTCFFLLFKIWLLENVKLHIWLTFYFYWTMLCLAITFFFKDAENC